MHVTSYTEEEMNPKLKNLISKLSDQYNEYKGVYDFPIKNKSTTY